jgi:hypothetical protein
MNLGNILDRVSGPITPTTHTAQVTARVKGDFEGDESGKHSIQAANFR